jgi:hypothetical protein
LNPGFIKPGDFYNTYDPAQSKFFWGQHAFQPGPTYNDTLYNTQPQAPNTPWGLQQIAQPLTSQQIMDLVLGKNVTQPTVQNATRRIPITEQNRNVMNYDYSKVGQLPVVAGPVIPNANAQTTSALAEQQNKLLAEKLGSNWFNRQQAAAAAGDWETYNSIQQQVNAILNPPVTGY